MAKFRAVRIAGNDIDDCANLIPSEHPVCYSPEIGERDYHQRRKKRLSRLDKKGCAGDNILDITVRN